MAYSASLKRRSPRRSANFMTVAQGCWPHSVAPHIGKDRSEQPYRARRGGPATGDAQAVALRHALANNLMSTTGSEPPRRSRSHGTAKEHQAAAATFPYPLRLMTHHRYIPQPAEFTALGILHTLLRRDEIRGPGDDGVGTIIGK